MRSVDILQAFLEFYTDKSHLDYCITAQGLVENTSTDECLLKVTDPNDPENNTARGSFNAQEAVSLFQKSLARMQEMITVP